MSSFSGVVVSYLYLKTISTSCWNSFQVKIAEPLPRKITPHAWTLSVRQQMHDAQQMHDKWSNGVWVIPTTVEEIEEGLYTAHHILSLVPAS